MTSDSVEPILHLNLSPAEVMSYISALYVTACPAFREHNGHIVQKRIIKQFPFSNQEAQLHHSGTIMLRHATHKISSEFLWENKVVLMMLENVQLRLTVCSRFKGHESRTSEKIIVSKRETSIIFLEAPHGQTLPHATYLKMHTDII